MTLRTSRRPGTKGLPAIAGPRVVTAVAVAAVTAFAHPLPHPHLDASSAHPLVDDSWPLLQAEDDRVAALHDLVAWASGHAVGPRGQPVVNRMEISTNVPEGRGLTAARHIRSGETMLVVKHSAVLSWESCSMPKAQKDIVDGTVANGQRGGWLERMSISLIYERHLGNASLFAPYIKTLPALDDAPTNVFYFTADQQSLAFWPNAMRAVEDRSKCCDRVVAALNNVARASESSCSSSTISPELRRRCLGDDFSEANHSVITWACSLAASRWQTTPHGPALRPVTDMTNHRFQEDSDEDIGTAIYQKEGRLEIRATRDWRQGEQMYDFYSWHGNVYFLAMFGFADPGQDIAETVVLIGSEVEVGKWKQRGSTMMAACEVAKGNAHYTQRLSISSPSGISETLSDCVRISKSFATTLKLEASLAAGFLLHSAELQSLLPLPNPNRERKMRRKARSTDWAETDGAHFELILDHCRAAMLTERMMDTLGRVGASNDTLSVMLHEAVAKEHQAASRCTEAMERRMRAVN